MFNSWKQFSLNWGEFFHFFRIWLIFLIYMIIIKEMIYGKFAKIIRVGCVFHKKVLNVWIHSFFFLRYRLKNEGVIIKKRREWVFKNAKKFLKTCLSILLVKYIYTHHIQEGKFVNFPGNQFIIDSGFFVLFLIYFHSSDVC